MIRLSMSTKHQIRTIVDALHVSTSDDSIRANMRMRTAPKHGMRALSQSHIEAIEVYAVKTHHQNIALYNRVQSGRI